MGTQPSFKLICGINKFPTDSDGHPVASRTFTGYPCYVSPSALPLYEQLEEQVKRPEILLFDELDTMIDRRDEYEINYWMHKKMVREALTDSEGNAKYLNEVFHYSSGEYGTAGLYGYKIGKSLGMGHDDMRYALVSLHEEYQESGYRLLPSMTLSEMRSPFSKALEKLIFMKQQFPEQLTREVYQSFDLRTLNKLKRKIRNKQCYPFFPYEFEEYANTALWLFQQLGFYVRKRDLHLILVWEWS